MIGRRVAWLLVLGLGACHASAPSKSKTPDAYERQDGGGAGAEQAPSEPRSLGEEAVARDDLESLEAQLGQAWGQLQVLEDAREPVATSPAPQPGPALDRCERIRGLADQICTLSDTMCALADEHRGEERYADSCGRAQQTCEQARHAADRCAAA